VPASKYKIWAVGNPVQDGVSGSVHVGVAAVAKKSNVAEPNIVLNELACNLLARALFLPCPPGVLLEHSGDTYFCSMNFNLAGQALPPTPVQTVVDEQPELCWGVLLFDVLMMNPDRHNRNLAYDRQSKKVQIFDHSRAFLPLKQDIDSVVAANAGRLGFQNHCLRTEMSSMQGFDLWCSRVKALPDYMIEETISALCDIGFPADKRQVAVDFIRLRRDGIDDLITNNIGQFPKLPQPQAAATAAAPDPGATLGQAPHPGGANV
jgi:hypothetical protein